MRAAAERSLAVRDARLPGLARVLDDAAFTETLREIAPEAAIENARGHYLRYKPGTRCTVAYRVRVGGVEHALYAVAHGADAPEKLAKARSRRAVGDWLGGGGCEIRAHGLVVRSFPNDARIPFLRRIVEPDGARRLAKRAGAAFSRDTAVRFDALAYKPERRFVACLDVAGRPAVVLRLYEPAGFTGAANASGAFASCGALRVATQLGASERHGAVALAWQEGEPLDAGDPDALALAGEALAALHAQAPMSRRTTPGRDAVAAGEAIGWLLPELALRARTLASRIALRLADRAAAHRALHGDLHAGQILIAGDRAVLLDLDRSGAGDPALDLATFAAHAVAAASFDPDAALGCIEMLCRGYRRVSEPPDARAIALHAAAAQLALAVHPFRNRSPDWPEETARALDAAETWLARSVAPRRRVPASRLDPGLPLLDAALDPARAAAPLERVLGAGTRLIAARLVRHKPGRRALIEYEVTREGVATTLLGKLAARGLDHRSLRTQERLHHALATGVAAVAEPVGAVPELGLWLQRKVAGRSGEALASDPGFAARVAEAAYALHEAKHGATRRHGIEAELRVLEARLPIVGWIHPEYAGDVERLLHACRALGHRLPAGAERGIHRDLHPGQVLDAGGRVVLLDLDLHAAGPPALDVGNYRAHLIELALRTRGDAAAHADAESALVERYVALAGERLRTAIDAWTALALARHVYLSTQYAERRATTAPLVALALASLGATLRDAA